LFPIQDEPEGGNPACWGWIINMQGGERMSLEQIQAFLEASEEIYFEGKQREEVYGWVTRTLQHYGYRRLGRAAKGLLRQYVAKMIGLSRAQVTRLVSRYVDRGEVKAGGYRRHRFPSRFTGVDIELLARVDEAHETLSGPATLKILYRELHEFGDPDYVRLAGISVAHLYNLRKTRAYRQRRTNYQGTKPTQVAIGERRCPDPNGKPGYLRVDTVHQGDHRMESREGIPSTPSMKSRNGR